jgi:rapamycin-insensitive companion of mTOR
LKQNYSMIQLEHERKDIMKHVTNLSHSVASRPAENSLLNLKRKYGVAFQHDLGLYYEVCQQLDKYNFRLHARRFLQELFLDIT